MMSLRSCCAVMLTAALGFTLSLSGGWGVPLARAESGDSAKKPDSKQVLGRAVGKPLLEANELMKAKKFQEALAKLQEADAVPNKTPYETATLEQLRGVAAFSLGDTEMASKSFEIVFSAGFMPPAEQLTFMEALAGRHFNAKNYAKAAEYAQRYFKNGGTSKNMHTLLAQALYFSGDYSGAVKELNVQLEADDKAGQPPAEETLQLLGNCYIKLKDDVGYTQTLERFVKDYPKREYWLDLLSRLQRKQGASSSLSLDFYRLLYVTGNIREPSDYMSMTQMALQAGFPAEAKKIVDEGFSKGVLGTGGDAARQKQLRDSAAKQAAEDQKVLAKGDPKIRSADALVNFGYAYVTTGQIDKGIALMEQGIAKGGLKNADEATLHLGMAYLQAGNKDKAQSLFKSIKGSGGVADVARMWVLYANKSA